MSILMELASFLALTGHCPDWFQGTVNGVATNMLRIAFIVDSLRANGEVLP